MKQVIHRVLNRLSEEIAARTVAKFRETQYWDMRTLNTSLELQREADRLREAIAARTPGCPLLYGYSVFSQCDEDGIIAHILGKIAERAPLAKTAIEFGAGKGLENNTHLLLLQGFKAFWVEGNALNVRYTSNTLGGHNFEDRLVLRESFITLENIAALLDEATQLLGPDIDLFSLDVDGNDQYFMAEAVKKIRPKLIVAEYNPKFPPPIRMTIQYNPSHEFVGDDFYGASLMGLVDVLPGYRLVSCNLTGVNAFFVREEYADLFPSFEPEDLYQPFRLHLAFMKTPNYPNSLKYLAEALSRKSNA